MNGKDIRRRIEQRVKLVHSSDAGPDTQNIWQTVYGDMMTNLMLFFLMMFALNMVGKDIFEDSARSFKSAVRGEKPEAPKPAAERENPAMNDFFKQFAEKEKDVQMIEQGEGIRLRLPEPVLFDLGKADLKPDAERLLHEFAQGLKNVTYTTVIEGHTDDIPVGKGKYKSNWELSEARAENVLNYLVEREGVPADRLAVAGFGEHWPFVPNDSSLNRALNRRIELLVITDDGKT
jgi:chemotaxis protein MotB